MAISNGYCTLNQLKDQLRIDTTDTADDALLERAVESASRQIDRYSNRRFWQDGSVAVRYYSATSPIADLYVDDISTATGLLVATDLVGDNSFSTSWTITTDFVLEPLNAAVESPVLPYTAIGRAWNTGKLWPVYREGAIRVTAKFGWPAVPKDIEAATVIQAGRLFSRRHSPAGTQGWQDAQVFVPWRPDPDVERLIAPYRLPWGAR